jgi:hypothetical protein
MVVFFQTSAQAITLISDFSSGIGGGNFSGNLDAAHQFTTGTVGLTVTGINVSWGYGNNGAVPQVGIFTDNAGKPSTTQVGSWFTNSTPVPAIAFPPATLVPTTLTYAGSATLSPSTSYWMVIKIADGSFLAWTNAANSFSQAADPSTQGAVLVAGSAMAGDITDTTSWSSPNPMSLIFSLSGTVDSTTPVNASIDLKETNQVTTFGEEIEMK